MHDGILAGLRRLAGTDLCIDVGETAGGGDAVLRIGRLRQGEEAGEQDERNPGTEDGGGSAD